MGEPIEQPGRVSTSMTTNEPGNTRRRWLVSAGVAVLILAGVLTFGLTRPDSVAPVDAMDTAATAVALDESGVVWSPEEVTVYGFTTVALLGTDGDFYALSTSPSVQQLPLDGSPPAFSIYRSNDGVTWSDNPISGLGDELWVRNFAEADGDLYVAGTAPSMADPTKTSLRVGWSADGGASWTPADLEVDATEPADMGQVFGSSTNINMAAASTFVLTAATTRFYLDYNSLIPPGVLTQSSFAQRTATGLEAVDFNECRGPACQGQGPVVLWSATWAELGIQPKPDVVVDTFIAPTGSLEFRPISTPFAIDQAVTGMFAVGEHVFVLTRSAFQSALAPQGLPLRAWRTPNGSDWEPVSGFPAMDNLMAFGPLGDVIGVIGQNGMQPVVGLSEDGGQSWHSIDLSILLPTLGQTGSRWITAAGIGPMGAFINVSSWLEAPTPPAGIPLGPRQEGHEVLQFLESNDLLSWSSTPSADLINGGVSQILVGGDSVLLTGFQMPAGPAALLGTRE